MNDKKTEDASTGAMDEEEAKLFAASKKEDGKEPGTETQKSPELPVSEAEEDKPDPAEDAETKDPEAADATGALTPAQVDASAPRHQAGLSMGGEIEPIIPKNLADLAQYAAFFVKAGMVPDNLQVKVAGRVDLDATKAKVMLVIGKGLEVKVPPQMAVANIMVVNNRTTIWGDLMRSLVMRSKQCEGWHEHFEIDGKVQRETVEIEDEYTAVCQLKRKGYDELWEGRFSCAQAKKAGLWMNPKKLPWMNYPIQMLMWRARTYAVRAGFSDVLGGLAIMEEIEDVTPDDKTVDAAFLEG